MEIIPTRGTPIYKPPKCTSLKQGSGNAETAYKIICEGTFPTLNEYISKMNASRYTGNDFKKQFQSICELYIMRDLRGLRIEKPVFIKYRYYEQNKKRDLDNVAGFFHKVFQDALTACGVLNNDGWANITGFEDRFYIDARKPRVEIEITIDTEEQAK